MQYEKHQVDPVALVLKHPHLRRASVRLRKPLLLLYGADQTIAEACLLMQDCCGGGGQ